MPHNEFSVPMILLLTAGSEMTFVFKLNSKTKLPEKLTNFTNTFYMFEQNTLPYTSLYDYYQLFLLGILKNHDPGSKP